ncbi:MAG: gamma-glutamyltransferase [Gammaproteobacteria bacterium]|nr:gamma-glutamyltransferase [Gammaproteobacteria bacterium]
MNLKLIQLFYYCYFILFFCFSITAHAEPKQTMSISQKNPDNFAIATAHPLATQAGQEILQQGGNAYDAAIAITATLAVVEPFSSGLGGGGFWLLKQADSDKISFIDGREMAPGQATKDMYLDENGDYIENSSINGPLSAGIPGTVSALDYLSKHYGNLPLDKVLAPAIYHAENGFKVTKMYRRFARFRLSQLSRDYESSRILLNQGKLPQIGELIIQKDLANTLKLIAKKGKKGFYEGINAEKMVKSVRENGGIWTLDDLKNYQVKLRNPIKFQYKNLEVYSAPPPSSGGIALNTILNILSKYPLDKLPKVNRTHLIIEAMSRAYRDRAQYLGDSDFIDIPIDTITSQQYAAGLRNAISKEKHLPSDLLPGFYYPTQEGNDTTHFVVIDKEGNQVSSTMSINYPFGSCFIAKGTGILLNDEMDDFSAKPGTPNAYGLVGSYANQIEPNKRPLSSMSPTIVKVSDEKGLAGYALLGTPGGSRIITMVLLGILDLGQNPDPASWVAEPRFHHQYLPDSVGYEKTAFTAEELSLLKSMGHYLKPRREYGNMQALWWDTRTGEVKSAADPRGEGSSAVFK